MQHTRTPMALFFFPITTLWKIPKLNGAFLVADIYRAIIELPTTVPLKSKLPVAKRLPRGANRVARYANRVACYTKKYQMSITRIQTK